MPLMPFSPSTPASTAPLYDRLPHIVLACGAALLAWEPLNWLVQTWLDPVYGSSGLLVLGLVLALAAWSGSSPLAVPPASRPWAWGLLLVIALLRLAGQVLAVNTLSALTLALDVYAVALLTGLDRRQRAVGPGWLALLFLCSLPLERLAQRIAGYGLQQVSADAACTVLSGLFDSVHCEGVRILLEGRDVLVDLPCSGSRGLVLLLVLYLALAAVLRPGLRQAWGGFALTLLTALGANVLRICLLAIGIAFPDWMPVSVMSSPWHDLIGLLALGTGSLPLLWWATRIRPPTPTLNFAAGQLPGGPVHRAVTPGRWLAGGFLLTALLITLAPARPVDVAHTSLPPSLPLSLNGARAEPQTLSPMEQAYFQRYGGGAARARYGELSLLLVSTAAPLRHLHAPDECLTGLGHQVEYLGPHYAGLPSALYRSTDPQGREWRVLVTFVSDRGETALSVAEAVWRWLRDPGSRWTQVQRISDWHLPAERAQQWDQAVARALELPVSDSAFQP